MAAAKKGDTVKVHYTGKLEDGTVFDSSTGREPLEFQVGEGEVIAGFDEAVVGMEIGQSKTTAILAENAYGPRFEEMVVKVQRDHLPPNLELRIDQVLQMRSPNGEVMRVVVTGVSESELTLDANHPLAGKNLS
ncbi:MAG: FKBP-type peptidyl-prolyl cis-trans isomerase, partial [Candidatus Lindowbacteria bacterium]|nr:FKBP-type peptidyl-prolyl cis-trans isomerase [Candidatus Lindowbacteria bacterium]